MYALIGQWDGNTVKFEQPVLVSLLLTMSAAPVLADMISPSHTCAKPMKPSQFATREDHANFNRQIGKYKQCLTDFVNEQNKEARMHSEAARKATNELKKIRT